MEMIFRQKKKIDLREIEMIGCQFLDKKGLICKQLSGNRVRYGDIRCDKNVYLSR